MKYLQTTAGMIISAIVLLALGFLIGYNWDNWFGTPATPSEGEPILDANGNPTGRFLAPSASAVTRGMGCCSVGQFFAGKGCKFPIKPTDTIPPCSSN